MQRDGVPVVNERYDTNEQLFSFCGLPRFSCPSIKGGVGRSTEALWHSTGTDQMETLLKPAWASNGAVVKN